MSEIWTGIAEVRDPTKKFFKAGVIGACVRVVGWAANEEDFDRRVAEAVNDLELDLFEMDEAEQWTRYLERGSLNDEYKSIAQAVQRNKDIRFGVFHTYAEETEGSL